MRLFAGLALSACSVGAQSDWTEWTDWSSCVDGVYNRLRRCYANSDGRLSQVFKLNSSLQIEIRLGRKNYKLVKGLSI